MATRPPRPQQIDAPGFDIGPDDVVVDVGCGDGEVCAYAGAVGAEVIGIDIDTACLALTDARMRSIPNARYRGILSACDPIPLPDGVASVVVATEVAEHVDDPARFAAELARIGKPGARYLISVPDPASERLMRAVAPDWYWRKPFHIRVFEHHELESLLTGAGLEPIGRNGGGAYWSLWWAFRMTLGAQPCEPTPDSPLLRHWEAVWAALGERPEGLRLAEALDGLLPKSQMVVARKPDGVGSASSFGGPSWARRRLRDGVVRVGGFNVRWSIRRLARAGEAGR